MLDEVSFFWGSELLGGVESSGSAEPFLRVICRDNVSRRSTQAEKNTRCRPVSERKGERESVTSQKDGAEEYCIFKL